MSRWIWALLFAVGHSVSMASIVFPHDAEWRYFPGRSEASPGDSSAWRQVGFDDSGWTIGKGPFYYENSPGNPTAYTGNTQLSDMQGNYTCVFLRKTFTINNPGDVQALEMVALSDDGFIAWLNGTEIARFNMPAGDVPFDGTALGALSEPVPVQTNRITQADAPLLAGNNVLTVQAFNSSISSSSDFVISVQLSSSADLTPPTLSEVIPSTGALVQQLTQIEVVFSEDVAGVDATDLLINGQPASKVTAFKGAQYLFEFPQPATGTVTVAWAANHGIHDLASAANPFTGETWSYTLDPNAAPPGVMISEFMTDNKKTLHDEDGDSSDWIELFNGGSTTVSLSGYGLTTISNAVQWRFPIVTLLPNSYLVVFASQKDRSGPGKPLHTNFKLQRDGGYLALLDPAGKVVSEFPSYPPQFQDVSYGRDRGNPTVLGYFPKPTPGAVNTPGGPGFSPDVLFSRDGGSFVDPFQLVLSPAEPGAAVHYTLDGSMPTAASPLYAVPIAVTNTVQVRALSYSAGLLPGAVHSETYVALASSVTGFSSDLPVVVIHNYHGGAVPAGSQQLANIAVFEPGYGRTSLTNRATLSVRAGINLRGSSTLYQSKSNFRVEFWDDYGAPSNHPLLGMPSDNDWVLYAPNNFEPVLIHNKFMHDLSRQIGRYSPRARFVEVYVNTTGGPITSANYNGVYVVLEKIKQGNDRVDIAELEPEQNQPPAVTGGYLMSVDRSAPGEGQLYAGGLGMNMLSPKWDELQQPQRAAQSQYITQFLDTLYSVLNGPNFADPVEGYAKYVDVDAAIDHHILNILAFNVDALRLSGYFYKPREGKLTFGPLWDFDRALGSTDGRDANPRIWRSTAPDYGTDMFNPDPIFSNPWYSQMFQDPDFWQHWIDRWQELRRHEFALTNLHALVDSLANQVREAEKREVVRWPGFTSPRGGSYQSEVDRMKTWLSNRVAFIDTNFLAAPVLSAPGGPAPGGVTLSISGPAGATVFYTLDGSDPRAPSGEVRPAALTNTGPIAIANNARVVARARDLAHHNLTGANKPPLSSPWSGPVAETYVVSTPPLIITELMYHPPAPGIGGTNTAEDFEYLELKNVGSQPLNLIGFTFTRGIEYTFTAASALTSLAPGLELVLVKNRAAFSSRYPGVNNIAGEYAGNLDNAGERITLQGPLQEPVLDITYDNRWYPSTDGPGFSLVAADESGSGGSNARDWHPSSQLGGSPGSPDPAPHLITPVLVNEALTHTDLPELDAIELFNPTSTEADVSGWFLSDDLTKPMKFRIPAGTVMAPQGYAVFDASQFNAGLAPFALSSLGEAVYLFSGDGVGLTGYAHGFNYGAAAHGVSFGRYVNSLGQESFVAQAANTLGYANAGPEVGPIVISEIMFNPPPLGTANNTRDEYVELYNTSGTPVTLYDPAIPTNTWRLRGGINLDFPEGLTLAPRQALLAVNFDPTTDSVALAAFASQYGVESRALLLAGPYQGNLDNAGDHVALYKPDPPEPPESTHPGLVPYVLADEVHYQSQLPWPTDAGIAGKALQRSSLTTYADDPVNWTAAGPSPGSVLYLAPVQISGNSCTLRFDAALGKSYSVLYRNLLSVGGWQKLADVPTATVSGPVQVTDTTFGTSPTRFYRLVTPATP